MNINQFLILGIVVIRERRTALTDSEVLKTFETPGDSLRSTTGVFGQTLHR